MKNLANILIAAAVLILASCTRQASNEPAPVKMTYEQLSKELTSNIAFILFDRAGKTEIDPATRGGRKVKANATLSVMEDLTLTNPGGGNNYESTTSSDAEWFSFQAFVTGATPDANAGAQAYCNHWYSTAAPPYMEPCTITDDAGRTIRTFTSDHNYDVHLSNKIIKP